MKGFQDFLRGYILCVFLWYNAVFFYLNLVYDELDNIRLGYCEFASLRFGLLKFIEIPILR